MAAALGNKVETLSTSAEVIVAASTVGSQVHVKNTHASIIVYVGKAGVTSANGYPLAAGASVSFDFVGNTPAVYAVGASGTPTVAVLRVTNE